MSGKILKHAIWSNTMLHSNHLPEFHANLIATLANLESYNFSRHDDKSTRFFFQKKRALTFTASIE